MTLDIEGFSFDGPFFMPGSLDNKSGVYIILSPGQNNSFDVVDIGESFEVKNRVENHERADCWDRNANTSGLRYSANYCDENERMVVEKKLRDIFSPPCGEK